MEKIKGFKGFGKDMKCRGFQYEVGKEYEQSGSIHCCDNGFHFCENPFDVFNYYAPCDSHYCEVEGDGDIDKRGNKVAVSHIRIRAELSINNLVKAGVKFIFNRVKWEEASVTNTGNYSVATNTGYCSAATNNGDYSAATNTGNYSVATNTGDYSAATNTGNRSAATNTGSRSVATNTGDYSAATNTGSRSAATNTGSRSAATNTGNCSAATVKGQDSVAIVTGKDSKAMGDLGCWIVLTERNDDFHILDMKAIKVDGDKIKSNTYYTLKNGEIIEVLED